MLGSNIFLAFLLGNFATSEGTICPAGTYHVPALDACFFYSTKVMDWNNAEEVGGFIGCYYMTSSVITTDACTLILYPYSFPMCSFVLTMAASSWSLQVTNKRPSWISFYKKKSASGLVCPTLLKKVWMDLVHLENDK